DESLHPSKQAAIVIGGNRLGVIGELQPRVAKAFDITGSAYLFEIGVTALLHFTVGHRMFQPIPRFPVTVRDIALVVDVKVSHQQITDIIKSFSLVNQVAIFDVYSGKQVPNGQKSLAYQIVFQSPTHTLTDKEVDKIQSQILVKLSQQLGAARRA
ncbi:MAG: phenylalanine--tRNA ligase subunit beta, partial [Dehalococcoidales bacterium]